MTEPDYIEFLSAAGAALRDAPVPLPGDPEKTAKQWYTFACNHRVIGAIWPVIRQWKDSLPAYVLTRWEESLTVQTVLSVRQEAASRQLAEILQQAKIPFVGLKGYVLRELYPVLRSAADVDFLIPSGERLRVRKLMRLKGYPLLSKGTNHDEYRVAGTHVELHHALMDEEPALRRYYRDIFERLEPVSGTEMRMNPEDFLIFQTVHAAKHFSGSGMGVRMLLDQYVYRHFGPPVDDTVLRQELEKLGLWRFYTVVDALSESVLSPDGKAASLSPEQHTLLAYICAGSLFGKAGQNAAMADGREGKGHYLLRRAFPSFAFMKGKYAVLEKAPWLLPVLWCWRLLLVLLRRNRHPVQHIRSVFTVTEEAARQAREIRRIAGLSE